MRNALKYLIYPILFIAVIGVLCMSITQWWDYGKVYWLTTLGIVLSLVFLETIFPLKQEWKMTWKSFIRDLKYIGIDIFVIAGSKALFGMIAIYYSQHIDGIFTKEPIIVGLIGYLLVFEFIQYWFHRTSHRAKWKVGMFLWNVHLAHHLPDKLYTVMHAVFHPINALITVMIVQTPLILLGLPPEAVLIGTMLIDLQSLISHANIDVRMWWLNYIFIGSESHRHHHSADNLQTKNYGNTLAIWDIVFGTFLYTPGVFPNRIGVFNPEQYPDSDDIKSVLIKPFK